MQNLNPIFSEAELAGYPPLMTCQDLADLLRFEMSQIRRLFNAAHVPPHFRAGLGKGAEIRIPRSAVAAWIAEQCAAGTLPVKRGRGRPRKKPIRNRKNRHLLTGAGSQC